MNRLTDMDWPVDSPAEALAAAVQSVEPLRASPERRAGILARVLLCRRAHGPAFFAFRSRAALAIALLSLGIATAAAAIGPRVRGRWASGTAAPLAQHRGAVPRPVAMPVASPGPILPAPAPAAAPVPRPARPRAAAGESPARLMAAVRALRTDGQPARGERLALDYLRAYPRGALAEEALAVAVEAAALNGDSRAAPLAQRYLRQYPGGRFRRVAEQTLGSLR